MKKGEEGKIIAVNVDGAAGERLYSLGIKAGALVKAVAFSLFNGSILISVGYNRVALRKSAAEKIEVTRE